VFIRKYDSKGRELWTRQFGSSSGDHGNAVTAVAEGVYLSGWVGAALPGQTSYGGGDAFVRKYDGSGKELWTRQFGSSVFDIGNGLDATHDGVYVVGYTSGALPGQTGAGLYDVFVRKYDRNGTEAWTRQFGTSFRDGAFGVAATPDREIYVVGVSESTLAGQSVGGGPFIQKYDSNGVELWTYQFASALTSACAVSVVRGGVYVAGTTFEVLPGQTTSGLPDIFLGILSAR
jgi:hypothetical protein